jgi:predicted transcriptional regulator/transcriptional regulator with XRE-family HTH domain
MAQKAWLGNKVRRMRRDQGLAQVEMASRLGISPSYLNLIEHNQRPLTLPLLLKLAQEFDVDLRAFSDNEEARLLAELTELLGDPLFREHDLGREDLKQLVAASPNACQAVLSLFRSYRTAREEVRALVESVSEDTYLATSTHELRELLATIRSFSEILHDYDDLNEEQRQQIHGILVRDSEKVTHYIDRMLHLSPEEALKSSDGTGTPVQEVTDFVHDQRHHLPDLEAAAEDLWRKVPLKRESLTEQLAGLLAERHGIEARVVAPGDLEHRLHDFDEKGRRLLLSEALPEPTRAFQMARQLGRHACADEIEAAIGTSRLADPAPQALARDQLAKYFAGALLLPYTPFLEAARETRHDLDLLCRRFQASFEQVCHRLTTLQRVGAEGLPFHFVRLDIAGNISKRYSDTGFQIPQYGGACPRWIGHAAFLTPGRTVTRIEALPDGTTFFQVARADSKPAGGHLRPQSHFSVTLGCDIARAGELVYSDTLNLDDPRAAVPVGVSCRLCERMDCAQRAFPPVLRTLTLESARQEPARAVGNGA